MNTKFKIYVALLGLFLAFAACQPEEFSLGKILTKDDLNYSITQNADDPNMIILESLTPGVTPLWVTPMGRSTRVKDTIRIPFAGDYEFKYGVESPGGYVEADSYQLSLTTNNLNYVNDPLWAMLTGGVGNSKTWLLDINAEGVSKYWKGPMYFSSDTWRWGNTCVEGSENCWIWEADWPGNTWIAAANNYGTMTFDLIGGANVQVQHMNSPNRGDENGVYFLDASGKTLQMTDAAPLMNDWADGANIDDWSLGYVISLTDDAMQIGYKDKGKEEFIIFNYISQEYSDNWVPEDLPDPEPPYNGDANTDLTTAVSTSKTWKVDLDIPYNWHGLDGASLNEVATTASEGTFAFSTWTPPYDEAIFSSISMTLTKGGDSDGTYTIETSTETFEGTYSVDESNNIDFGQAITFFSGVGGWLTFGTTGENTLRVLISEKDAGGNITGLWLGQRSAEKDEYFSVHLVPSSTSGGNQEPEGTEITFDNSKLVFGDLEGNGNLRLELYNDFGSTKDDPPLDAASVVFDNRMEITFTLQGISFADGAAGSYATAIGLADADWSAQYWGDGAGEVSVTGDGTYTVYCDPGSSFDTALVFVVDVKALATDISDLSSVTATIDKVVTY